MTVGISDIHPTLFVVSLLLPCFRKRMSASPSPSEKISLRRPCLAIVDRYYFCFRWLRRVVTVAARPIRILLPPPLMRHSVLRITSNSGLQFQFSESLISLANGSFASTNTILRFYGISGTKSPRFNAKAKRQSAIGYDKRAVNRWTDAAFRILSRRSRRRGMWGRRRARPFQPFLRSSSLAPRPPLTLAAWKKGSFPAAAAAAAADDDDDGMPLVCSSRRPTRLPSRGDRNWKWMPASQSSSSSSSRAREHICRRRVS